MTEKEKETSPGRKHAKQSFSSTKDDMIRERRLLFTRGVIFAQYRIIVNMAVDSFYIAYKVKFNLYSRVPLLIPTDIRASHL